LQLWRVVIAVWVVSLVVTLPALWVVGGALAPDLRNLPAAGVPEGDVPLIVGDALEAVRGALVLAIASGAAALWAFTVLWHAGVVGWTLWGGGRRVRLGEVLGFGIVSWWRYARLSLTAAAAFGFSLALLWAPLWEAVGACYRAMEEGPMVWLLVAGVILSKLLVVIIWCATLRGAWLLGLPERRSAVASWLRGLAGSLRTPVASLGTVLLWAVPATTLSVVPLALGLAMPELRGGLLIPVLGQVASAVRAFCWVALFLSFAPATVLVGPSALEGAE
jgi:hypothetical protein